MQCSVCHTPNRAAAKFCATCGESLSRKAPRRSLLRFSLRAARPRLISIRLLLMLVLVLGTVISCTVLSFSPAAQQLGPMNDLLRWFGGQRNVTTHQSLVQGMQSMSTLTSAKYTLQTIVEMADTGDLGPLTTDRILLRADADVIAGIDLRQIKPEHVQISGDNVTITLPPPTLVSREITYHVYDRQTGWFAFANKDLQTAAEAQARSEIVKTACAKGILNEAQTNAEATLRSFLLSLGFEQATFVATAPAPQTCTRP